MNRPLLIHIGYHKTGSTFLQKNVFEYDKMSFSVIGGVTSKLLASEILKVSFSNMPATVRKTRLVEFIESNIDHKDRRLIVASNEALSGFAKLSFTTGEQVFQTINNCFDSAKIIIGIREQTSWLKSMYFQYLRMGGTLKPKEYFFKSQTNYFSHSINYDHLFYHRLISLYINAFGKDNVLVYPYEKLKINTKGLLEELKDFIQLSFETKGIQSVNAHYNLTSLELLRRLSPILFSVQANAFSSWGILKSETARRKATDIIVKLTPGIFDKYLDFEVKDYLPNDYIRDIRNSNSKLEKMININLKELGYMMNRNCDNGYE